MTRFTSEQSSEIDDRIVQMVVAALGEGDAARRCRAIPNERYLDSEQEIADEVPVPASLVCAECQSLPSESNALHKGDTISACEARRMDEQARTATAMMTPTMRQVIATAGSTAVFAAWQPVAAAPLDEWVLTFCPSGMQRDTWPSAPWIIARRDRRGTWHDYSRRVVFPTHWMEMSAPQGGERTPSLIRSQVGSVAVHD